MRILPMACGAVGLACVTAHSAAAWSPPAFDPSHVTDYGYRLVYDAEFNSIGDVDFDMSPTAGSGAKLYGRMFDKWGGIKQSATPQRVSVTDGVLTIAGGQLSSIAPAKNDRGYIGMTFAGGGYAEARLKWDRDKVRYNTSKPINNLTNWWPSFYAVPAEYFVGGMEVPGGGQDHFVENDWFEAWTGNNYGATLHDWFGPKGCYPGASNHGLEHCEIGTDGHVMLPSGEEPKDPTPYGQTRLGNRVRLPPDPEGGFHVIGALWVSAEHTPDHVGYAEFFFDGKRVGQVKHWVAAPKEVIPPPVQSLFSELDRDHSALFIGAPDNSPLQVDWIHVWQLGSVPLSNPAVKPEPGFTGPNGHGK